MADVLDRVEGKIVYAADVLDLFYVASVGQDKAFIRVVEDVVENVPAIDAAEVRYGEWEIKSEIYQMFDDVDEELYVECPLCKRRFYVPFEFDDEKTFEYAEKNYPYCNCGAKMSGGTNKC